MTWYPDPLSLSVGSILLISCVVINLKNHNHFIILKIVSKSNLKINVIIQIILMRKFEWKLSVYTFFNRKLKALSYEYQHDIFIFNNSKNILGK